MGCAVKAAIRQQILKNLTFMLHCNSGQIIHDFERRIRKAIGVLRTITLAVVLGSGPPVFAAEPGDQPINLFGEDDPSEFKLAQFQLPKSKGKGGAPIIQLPKRLTYAYGYGSESEIEYRKHADLNRSIEDDLFLVVPELNGHVTYRPTDWFETTLEIILDREIDLRENEKITLPDGEVIIAPKRRFSLLVDQANATFKGFLDPFAFTIGRRNFEDPRHWLYDTSIDVAMLSLNKGKFRAEAFVGRETLLDLDLLKSEPPDRINTFSLYTEYRGIEDIKLAGYGVLRDDRNGEEGRPLLMGIRSLGNPTINLSYWAELAYLRGRDEVSRSFSAYAFDIGGTYRFYDLPLNPNITVGIAFATGDDASERRTNNEFRQTGLQSNERRFAGVSEFLAYGEALDPELSNIRIITVGLGFRPIPDSSIDFVYHHYRLDEIAEEIRNSGLVAKMNQDETRLSKDVGNAFDIVLGIRSLFGIRRLGMDLRGGWFFPGKAFRIDKGGENFRSADKGLSVVAKFWW